MSPSPLQKLLIAHGYDLVFRDHGWAECLLERGEERWFGQGKDREGALLHVVSQAFPSALARSLLEQALDASSEAAADLSEPPVAEAQEGEATTAESEAPQEPLPAVPAEVPTMPTAAAPSVASAEVPKVPPVWAARISEAEAIEGLANLRATVEIDSEELGLCAPPRQRLVLLAWMARARAYQEDAASSSRVYEAVRSFAKLIGQLAKEWWPGNVPALQISSRPIDALKTLPAPDSAPPMTWSAVADLAEVALYQMEQDEILRGRDDYGWADAARLLPPPDAPDELLAALVARVEAIAPLGKLPESAELPSADTLLEWVRKLRWLRDGVEDVKSWARLAGRLRFWSRRDRDTFATASRELDHLFVPERSWALVLRAEAMATADAQKRLEEEARRAEELQRLLEEAPKPDDAPSEEVLAAFLARALPFTDTFQEAIASVVLPFRDSILEIDPANLEGADRRIRRRLAKLQDFLAQSSRFESPPASVQRAISEVRPVEELLDIELPNPGSELRRRVMGHTKGRRAVFVSNRTDEGLRERIEELFDFETLDWVEAEPRRIDSVAETIAAGTYDFVLGATGFMDHTVDGKLSRACRRTEARYIRVNRGRPVACLRAVARSLGELQPDAA